MPLNVHCPLSPPVTFLWWLQLYENLPVAHGWSFATAHGLSFLRQFSSLSLEKLIVTSSHKASQSSIKSLLANKNTKHLKDASQQSFENYNLFSNIQQELIESQLAGKNGVQYYGHDMSYGKDKISSVKNFMMQKLM